MKISESPAYMYRQNFKIFVPNVWIAAGISQKCQILLRSAIRPQKTPNLTFLADACCNPNIWDENFEILSIHISWTFGNFHLASSPIFRGPMYVLSTHNT